MWELYLMLADSYFCLITAFGIPLALILAEKVRNKEND